MKKYPNRRSSSYIQSLTPGDILTCITPLQGFQWKPNQFSHIYLLAGGVGITPIYQLIQGILKNPEDKTKITLLFGVNTEEDLLLRDELKSYAKRFSDQFTYTYTISHPKEDISDFRKGYIDQNLISGMLQGPLKDSKVFICGPPAMEKSLIGSWRSPGILSQLGFSRDQIHKF